jgi:uncharacterized membrane protein (DUF2068 family)
MLALAYASSMVMIGAVTGFPAELAPAYASLGSVVPSLIAMAAALAWVIGSIGLWSMQRWAYWLAVAGAAITLLAHLLPRLGGLVNTTSALSGALAGAILVYMLLPSVRRAFFEAPASDLPPSRA